MIWGMVLHPGVVYTRNVMAVEYLTLASLDCRPGKSRGGANPMAHLKLQINGMECILCTLEKGIVHQQSLDYVFQHGDTLRFIVEGNSVVYITGYYYRHPVVCERRRNGEDTSALVRGVPSGINNDDVSPTSFTGSEEIQPRIMEGTVTSVKNEPVNVSMEVGEYSTEGQTDFAEFLTETDEDSTESEKDHLLERPDSDSADPSGVRDGAEEETDQEMNKEINILSKTPSEGTSDHQEIDESRQTALTSTEMGTQTRSDFEPHSQSILPIEEVTDCTVDSRGGEDRGHLLDTGTEQMQLATDYGLNRAETSSLLSDSAKTEEAVVLQTLTDGENAHSTDEHMVEDSVDTVESLSSNDVRVSFVAAEEVSQSWNRETLQGSNESQQEHRDPITCTADLKIRKVSIVLHRMDTATLFRSEERPDDCCDHLVRGNETLCKVETDASEGAIENQVSGKETSGLGTDIEMANILLEIHSGQFRVNLEESNFTSNIGAVEWEETRTGGSGTECPLYREPGDIVYEEDRLSTSSRHESQVKCTDSIQEARTREEVTVSPDEDPINTCSQNELANEHLVQPTYPKNYQNRQEATERQLRSATDVTKERDNAISSQGSAFNQETFESIKNKKRTLTHMKEVKKSNGISRKKVILSNRKVLINNSKSAGNNVEGDNCDETSFTCQFCQKVFNRNFDLMVHKRIHNGEKPFQCKSCDKKFTFKSYLLRHERSHTGEKPFSCTYCQKKFTMKSYVLAHERIHTGKYPFKCKYCGRNFVCKSKLQYHENIHTGEKLFECKFCGKKFTMKSFLVCHERIHTGEKPFQCSHCEKRFVQKAQMEKHERTHTGEKPFSCRYCAKKFSVKSVLKYHERTHTGEKTFQCQHCDKRFTWRRNWIDHTRIHTGDRPFSCKYCEKKFFQKIILLQHEAIHTGENRFKCIYCKKGFAWKNSLMRHQKTHTGKKSVS